MAKISGSALKVNFHGTVRKVHRAGSSFIWRDKARTHARFRITPYVDARGHIHRKYHILSRGISGYRGGPITASGMKMRRRRHRARRHRRRSRRSRRRSRRNPYSGFFPDYVGIAA